MHRLPFIWIGSIIFGALLGVTGFTITNWEFWVLMPAFAIYGAFMPDR